MTRLEGHLSRRCVGATKILGDERTRACKKAALIIESQELQGLIVRPPLKRSLLERRSLFDEADQEVYDVDHPLRGGKLQRSHEIEEFPTHTGLFLNFTKRRHRSGLAGLDVSLRE
jgi:hypothetical protein